MAMFTVLYQVVLRPLDFETPEELLFIHETSPDGAQTYSVSIPNFFDWRERNRTLRSLSAFRASSFNWTDGDTPLRIRGAMVSGDFFQTLGVEPSIGRTFDGDEDRAVVLSHSLWQRRFGGRDDVVGERLTLDGRSFVVSGVLPESFEFLTSTVELWLPIGVFRDELPWNERGSHPSLWTVGRMADGVTIDEARRDLERVHASIHQDFDHNDGIAATALHERSVRRSRSALTALMGGVGLCSSSSRARTSPICCWRALPDALRRWRRARLWARGGRGCSDNSFSRAFSSRARAGFWDFCSGAGGSSS